MIDKERGNALDDALAHIESVVSAAPKDASVSAGGGIGATNVIPLIANDRQQRRGKKAGGDGAPRRPRQRTSMLDLGGDIELWRDASDDGFVSFDNANGVRSHAPILSKGFKDALALRFLRLHGEVPGASALDDTLRIFSAQALLAPMCEPILRLGSGPQGTIVFDRCVADGSYVEIGPHGFQTMADGRPKFIRKRGMLPLVEPEPGSSVSLLRPFINVATEEGFVLVVAWLLMALRPSGPYPILVLSGEQGTGKSTVAMLLRRLVDPSAVPIASPPRDLRDFIVGAVNARVLCFDNLSKIDADLSDALCRMATGGGARARALHTDNSETLFMGSRPQILNGIGDMTERADLSDRTLVVRLAAIDESARRSERDLWREFAAVEPSILGSLLSGVSAGLRNFETTKLYRAPRLADFAHWVSACETGLGEDWVPGTFSHAYGSNRSDAREAAFDADLVATSIDSFVRVDRPEGWCGTPSELLAALNMRASEEVKRRRDWPFTPQGLGNRLERAAPLLRARGFTIERRHSGKRTITIGLKQ